MLVSIGYRGSVGVDVPNDDASGVNVGGGNALGVNVIPVKGDQRDAGLVGFVVEEEYGLNRVVMDLPGKNDNG